MTFERRHRVGLTIGITGALALAMAIGWRLRPAHWKAPFSARDPLVVSIPSGAAPDSIILDALAARRELLPQRGIGSIPALSSFAVASRLRQVTGVDVQPAARFSLNWPQLLESATARAKMFAFGGTIIYGTNLENVRSLSEYSALVAAIRARFTFTVFAQTAGPQSRLYRITIRPFVVADCDLSYRHFRYCRGPFLADRLGAADSLRTGPTRVREITRDFAAIGLNSALSPEVDLYPGDSVTTMVDLAQVAATSAQEAGLVPVLKHFVYDRTIADAHDSSYFNPISDSAFRRALAPYFAVEALGQPYFIMVSHQRLPLDPTEPLPRSRVIEQFIRSNFPTALTMSDAINMGGLHRGHALREVVRTLRTDSFLFQSGNATFLAPEILLGVADADTPEAHRSVRRLLDLKRRMGLLTIEPVAGGGPRR